MSAVCSYNVSEKDGTVAVTVKRTGNLNQYAIVLCRTEQGTATSTSSMGSRAGQQDYVEYAGQVCFNVFYIISKCFLYNTQIPFDLIDCQQHSNAL